MKRGFEKSNVRDSDKRAKRKCFIPRSIVLSSCSVRREGRQIHATPTKLVGTEMYLPVELVTEILEWLPIRSIARFKCVSKLWSALFKTRSFIKRHRLKQGTKGTMLLLRRRYPPPLVRCERLSFHNLDSPEQELRPYIPTSDFKKLLPEPTEEFPQMKLVGSVNGIICIQYEFMYILSNPALHQYKPIPPLSDYDCVDWSLTDDFGVSGFGVAYSSSSSSGSNNSDNSEEYFKIITMRKPCKHKSDSVACLYDTRTNSWRQVDDALVYPYHEVMQHVIYHNGACHWPAHSFSYDHRMILSFNMTTEVFKELELPNCFQQEFNVYSYDTFHPIVMDNSLGLVQYKEFCSESDPVEIWVMKEYGVRDSWAKLFVIGPQPVARVFMPWKDNMLMVQVPQYNNQNGPRRIEDCDPRRNCYLTSITLRTNEMKRFEVFGAESSIRAMIYEESLVSLK